jgi:hypothetical protein
MSAKIAPQKANVISSKIKIGQATKKTILPAFASIQNILALFLKH